MIKKTPETAELPITIVTWENDSSVTEARVFETTKDDEEVTDFLAVLLNADDSDEELRENDVNDGVDVDTIQVYEANEGITPKKRKGVTYEE